MKQRLERFIHRLRTTENPFIRATLKHSPMYLGASLFSGIAGLAMTKYYTHVFTPAEYGVMSLYIVMFQYVRNLVAFTVDSAAQRPYFDFAEERRGEFIGTVVMFVGLSSVVWAIGSVFAADTVIGFIGGNRLIFAVTMLVSIVYAYWNFFSRIAYNEHLSTIVAKQGFLQTFLNHAASAGFISLAGMGVLGYQLGSLVAYTTSAVVYLWNLIQRGVFEFRATLRPDVLRRIMFFAVPSFMTVLITSTLSYVDRYLLNRQFGPGEVGVYSLGFTVGMGLSLVIESVSSAMFPAVMRSLKDDYQTNISRLRRFDRMFAAGLILAGFGIFALRAPIVTVISNSGYSGAVEVMPFIAFGFVFGGMYKNASVVLSFHDIVRFLPWLSAVSWTIGAGIGIALIPRYGGIAAGYANLVAQFVYSLVVQSVASRYLHTKAYIAIVYGGLFAVSSLWFIHLLGLL